MTKFGYAYKTTDKKYLEAELASLEAAKCDEIILETGEFEPHEKLDELVENLRAGDQIVIHELICLGKSIIQLAEFIADLETIGAELKVLNKSAELEGISDETYAVIIKRMAAMEKTIIRERTARGLEEARRKGRIGGRPKISAETIARIQFLYSNNKYTLRQIAEECNISLGTAYKYTQKM